MINLLSPNDRKQLAASRTNTLLLRYLVATVALMALIIIEMSVVYFFFASSKNHSNETIASNEQSISKYGDVKKQANEFRSNLTTAKDILSKQVSFTAVLKELSNNMPPGTVLDSISLDPAQMTTPTTITVQAKDEAAAIRFKEVFHASSVFADVSFASLTRGDTGAYPYTATYNVTFNPKILEAKIE